MLSSDTASGIELGICSRAALAASSDSKTTIDSPELSCLVQYPATNPGACDTPGTTLSRSSPRPASGSPLIVTLVTTACMVSLLPGFRDVTHRWREHNSATPVVASVV